MKQFFKSLFTTVLGVCIALLVMVFVGIGIVGGIVASIDNTEKEVKIKDKTVLHIQLNSGVKDRSSSNPFEQFDFGSMESKKTVSLRDFTEAIAKAKADDRIKGIYLDLSSPASGMGTLEEMRNALIDFKTSGKWIVSYSENYSQYTYYFASVADEIYMYPEGDFNLAGLRSEIMFFKGALEKLEIEPQVIRGRNNRFKSAVEPFMYDKMSDANRAQMDKILSSLWGHMLMNIEEERGVSIADLNKIADSLLIRSSADAIKFKLIDKAVYKDEVLAILRDKLEIGENDDINTASVGKYANVKLEGEQLDLDKLLDKTKVAVVYAIGGIESGQGDDETIGSERISKAIREARLDSTVKSVVLRVNSPGGSALASDVIWREVLLCKEAKPVVVSMGDVAASGGYYIACAADKIYADPTTITGSIGVFGVIPNMKNFFNNKLGVTFDGVKTNAHSDMMTTSRPLDDFEHRTIQIGVEKIYDDFISKVAAGRGMTKEAVDAIGQGRVWTGIDAKEIGLIDDFGGLEEAIIEAAALAEVTNYEVVDYPKQKDTFEEIIKELKGEVSVSIMEYQLGDNYKYYKQLENIKSMKGIQARLPYNIEFK
jgi:protease-4